MTDERRYGEDDVREILARATRTDSAASSVRSKPDGLTLSELQEIGSEVDLHPERIAEAAAALDLRRGALPRRRHLGMPISAGRTIDLPRVPTDHEWELLISELRATFGAHGHVSSDGATREWRNGNLHAYVERTETGHRLRLGTLKGSAPMMNALGIGGLVMGLIVLSAQVLGGDVGGGLVSAMIFWSMGGAALAYNAVSLPRWALERERQMEAIAGRAQALVGSDPGGADRSRLPAEGEAS